MMPPMPFSNLQLEWQIPEWRAFYEHLTQGYRVIRYDARGSGLSDRDSLPTSLESHLADLEAVVEHLGLERFAILAITHSGVVAMEYASVFPSRVSHLLLWCAYHRNTPPPPDRDWEPALLKASFRLYSETIATACAGDGAPGAARALAHLFRESMTPASMEAHMQVFREVDVSARLAELSVPTLVMHRRELAVMDSRAGLRLAQRIPGARLVMLEGDSVAAFLNDTEPVYGAIADFLPMDVEGGETGHDHLRELVAGKDFTFSDRGETELRGIGEPVRVWELLYI